MKKRAFCLLLAAALSLSALCACTAGTTGANGDSSTSVSISTPSKGKNAMSSRLVGISMPEQAGRWEQEATTMQTILQAKDYTVELAYADNNSATQIEQVKAMLDDDCGAIIVASVDSEALSDALATCDTSNTTMIAYSTLVPDCSTIDYFIGIDSYTNGQIQAKYLVQKLGLKKTKKSFNLEIFHQSNSGSALYAFLGAMDVLKPYLDDSTLVIPSDRTTAEACGVADGAAAKQELSHLLESTYADGKPLDAILCTDDTLSVAVAQELEKEYAGSVFPLISGCNCNPESIQLLIDGKAPGPDTRRLVSYLPERTYLSDWMTVVQLLDFFCDFYPDFDRDAAEHMLTALEISPTQHIKQMSKGTREKVQLILVMSRRTRLYLLDEPIGGVDPATRDYIIHTILTNFNPDSTLLISTHLIADVERILDDVVFISRGQLVLHQSVDQIRQERGCSVDDLFREVFRYAE